MPFGSDCSERAPIRAGGCPSCGIFQMPAAAGIARREVRVQVVVLVEREAGQPGEERPQNVSGGAPSGSMA
jgi:hypothetical protein